MNMKQTLRPSPTAILNPRIDVNFKAMFTQETEGSQIALKSFLSSVLGKTIKEVNLTANEPPVDAPSQMQMTFDVAVKFDDGERASIEMIWRVSCQYQRTKKGQFQSLTGFDHYDIRGFNKLSYPRSMVRRKLLHYANGNQFYRKIQLS